MPPDPAGNRGFADAFEEIAGRVAGSLANAPQNVLPVKMFVAGGAALHFHTGHRLSMDVDAWFSHRLWLPDDLEVAYRDADGGAQMLYFDRQNTFEIMHPDAEDDSVPLELDGVEPGTLEVRLVSALDLAVSKVGRFSKRDRSDIAALAENGLIRAEDMRRRAQESVQHHVGNKGSLKTSIARACRLVADIEVRREEEQRKRRVQEPPSPDVCP